MNYILFDGPSRNNLLPFTFTRPVADIRIGILTIREKWETYLKATTTTVTEDYLSDKYPMVEMDENIMINASYLPNFELAKLISDLKENQAIFKDEDVIAFFTKDTQDNINFDDYEAIEFIQDIIKIENTWDIFSKNGEAIQNDFILITKNETSQPIPESNNIIALSETKNIDESCTITPSSIDGQLAYKVSNTNLVMFTEHGELVYDRTSPDVVDSFATALNCELVNSFISSFFTTKSSEASAMKGDYWRDDIYGTSLISFVEGTKTLLLRYFDKTENEFRLNKIKYRIEGKKLVRESIELISDDCSVQASFSGSGDTSITFLNNTIQINFDIATQCIPI